MILTNEEILKIAIISRIGFDLKEVASIKTQIQDVLSYAKQVETGVVGVSIDKSSDKNKNLFRQDQSRVYDKQYLIKNAPEFVEEYFVVPAIL